MAKRGYKLQEFVAHSGNVNCLSIGKKACRLFLTGGEDNKVNVWAIGKPNSLMTLCGHTSPVDSVAFDSAETLVLGGASSGVLKLWDLEEAKMVRGLTGHRSNCTAVEFHPFGEFFASGSMDTNLKIWDIRKKGCIHTYKGHTRGISTIRFTPDGRWVVSGGYDNIVKVWDLTAGKLLHDFKFHENHIRTIEFHPLEFLLATGSADRTVKFWDLETFELIGSTRPEGTAVRAIAFNPDGRTLFCGLDDSMKVYSWEPMICHDSIEMGWSTLSDLCIHEGKLLGCSYYQNSVGVWVSDVSLIGPYGTNTVPPQKDNNQHSFNLQKSSSGKRESHERLISSLRCPSPDYETKEIKNIYVDTANGNPVSSQRNDSLSSPKIISADSPDTTSLMVKKHGTSAKNSPEKSRGQASLKSFSATDSNSQEILEIKDSSAPRRESITFSRTKPGMLLKPAHRRRHSSAKIDSDGISSITDMKNVSEAKNSLDSFDPMLPKHSSHRRRLSNTKFDIENLSDPSEVRSFSESRIDFNGPLETDIKNVPEAHGESIKEECSVIKGVSDKVSPQTTKDDNRDETLGSSRQEITSVKIVRGVAVVSGRTRTLVEKFERRDRLNEGEDKAIATPPQLPATDKLKLNVPAESKETINSGGYQSLDGPSNLTSASRQTPAAASPSERREEMCNNTIEQATRPSNIISARSQVPAADCPLESRKEMCNYNREQATAQPTPCAEPSRSKMPPTLISTTNKGEPHISNDQETTVFRDVIVLPKDESPNSPERELRRRTRVNMKQDRGVAVVPNVVLRRERTPINQVSSSERKQRVSKEDQSVITVSPNVALRRDKLSINQVGRLERRERNNGKEDQPTRVSSHVVPSRERTPPTLGGNMRRERLTHPEVQATNHVMPVIEKNIEAIGCFEGRERFHTDMDGQESNMPLRTISVIDKMATELVAEPQIFVAKPNPADEKDVAEALMETHEVFLSTLRSRLTKLQVIRHFFGRNDVKGAIDAIRKLPDHAVQADFIGILVEKMEMVNLDLFSSLLPVLVGLLDSKIERHTSLSLEMLLKLVAVFGSLVFDTVSAPPNVGVDLHAEQRRECCNQCFAQLQKIQKVLPLLVRRGGVVARCAQELNLVLQQS